jgi:streptogramin lyase
VAGAQIQLYVAGDAGNGSASSALLNAPVASGPDGTFSITGDYSCPSATAQVYIVATQGNPGLGSGGNNPALAMMAPLGSCGNLSPTQFISINEVTTAAAAWALAPFTQDISHIGASSTNSRGLANAFLNAQLIADTSTGMTATLPSGLTTEAGKIYALADAVASCINSDGTTGCSPLFTAATPSVGGAPTNTWNALLNIVKNPANNVAGVFKAIGPQPPFPTTLSTAPNDWTLSLTVTGGGIDLPEALGVDSQGNVWVTNRSGVLSGVNPQGTPLSSAGFGSATGSNAFGLTIDPNDNIWITLDDDVSHNGTKGSIEEFSGISSGAALGTPSIITDNSLNYPYAIAADSNGTLFIANYYVIGNATNLVKFDPAVPAFTAISTGTDVGFPVALAPDSAHGVWITSGGIASLAHVDASNNVVATINCCGQTDAVAVDSEGMVWLADTQNSSSTGGESGAVTVLASDGTITHDFIATGGITIPSHIAIDAAQNVWISNLHTNVRGASESISELAGSNSSNPGAALSPSTGYGLDANLGLPYGLAVDPSGNIWVSNTPNNSLVMFFGMAAPTKTPQPPTPQAP